VADLPGEVEDHVAVAHEVVHRALLPDVRDVDPQPIGDAVALVTATPGPAVDYDYVRNLLVGWSEEFDVKVIAYDPWNATDLVHRLEKADGFTCVKVRQGFATLSAPSKSLETAIVSKKLRHDGHPVLRWNIANMSVESDAAGNIKPSKELSTERIDGGYALIMAIDAMERNDHTPPPTYEMVVLG
jgi:phage terminase large subunit-like protein